jgi:hypothetical protein
MTFKSKYHFGGSASLCLATPLHRGRYVKWALHLEHANSPSGFETIGFQRDSVAFDTDLTWCIPWLCNSMQLTRPHKVVHEAQVCLPGARESVAMAGGNTIAWVLCGDMRRGAVYHVVHASCSFAM